MKKFMLICLCAVVTSLSGCNNIVDGSDSTVSSAEDVGGYTSTKNPDNTSADSSFSSENVGGTASGTIISDFQKEMNIVSPLRLRSVCKTENGYYLQNEGLVYFMDYATGQMIVACGKPECSHNDVDCNAWVNSSFMSYYNGKLYYCNSDTISDGVETLWSMNLDGTNHTKIQSLQIEKNTSMTSIKYIYQPIISNGYIYYIENNTMLYKNRLGADISEASLLINEDTAGKRNSTWKYWADGVNVYAMNNFMNSSGEFQEVLYLLGESLSDTKEIWKSSRLDNAVVSESYWYITGGNMYYYLSGGDLWNVDLNSGKSDSMLRLSNSVKSGQALFTEANIIVFDSGNMEIAVYDYNGGQQHKIGLSSVNKEYSDIYSCDLVFADGDNIYMLAYHGTFMSPSSSLYQINWTSEGFRELDTWPASKVQFQNNGSDKEHIIQIGR